MKIIKSDKVIYEFRNDLKEIARVRPNEEFIVETNDCFYQQIQKEGQVIEEINHDNLNPATGPIYVEGAEVGDILKVIIKKINIKDSGCAMAIPGFGVLNDKIKTPTTKIINIKDGYAHFSDEIKIPISPMIGVIGVAPFEKDGNWTTDTPYKHGGNMDTKEIKEGSVIYFQVATKGAMLALGDLHAVMGDGEVSGTGLEIPGEVTLKTEVIKGKTIEYPLLETDSEVMIIASGDDMNDARDKALDTLTKLMMKALNLSFEESLILSSLAVDIRISQLVDPKITIRSAISKNILPIDKIINSL